MRPVAIVSFAQAPSRPSVDESDAELLFPLVEEAIAKSGVKRSEIGFTCSGSADYITGGSFTFVQTLEVAGAWPPIAESHVEMDGAWAMYEAWVRLQEGDIDSALVYSSGLCSRGDLREVLAVQLDPYYLAPLWPDYISLAALQAQAFLARNGHTENDLAAVAARARANAENNPNAQVRGAIDERAPYVVEPLREFDCPPVSDSAAAMVLVAGDRARDLCERPAWITGFDHRIEPHYPGMRDLSVSTSARLAAEGAGVGRAPVEVAELSAAFSYQELMLAEALGLGSDTEINPSGGALVANPMMVTGLIRIGEAFRQINENGKHRTLGHATSGPCLQQNLVCVLEGDS